MSNIVIQMPLVNIEKMQSFYEDYKTDKTPPGAIFIAKKNGCTITAYRSGKVMFQGAGNEKEAQNWSQSGEKIEKTISRKTSGTPLPTNIASMSAIGSDEVGKGDYFGPMTVVAAYVKKDQMLLLKELGVKDSKNLSDSQIITIAKDLLTFLPYSLLALPNEKYNQLQASGMTQGKITAILHNQALNHLLKKIEPEKPEAILID